MSHVISECIKKTRNIKEKKTRVPQKILKSEKTLDRVISMALADDNIDITNLG